MRSDLARIIALSATLGLSACAAPGPITLEADPSGEGSLAAFSVSLDNDSLVGEDNAYTNGFGLTWTSRDVSDAEGTGFFGSIAGLADVLPYVNEGPTFVTVTFAQQIFTPDDITTPTPNPNDQPYAGALFFDFGVHARDEQDLHTYRVRAGIVGPESQAEWAQKKVHSLLDLDRPAGWDSQLETEPLLDIGYEYHHRIPIQAGGDQLEIDTTPHAGVVVGTYTNAASVGIETHFGRQLPDTFGVNTTNNSSTSTGVLLGPEAHGSLFYGFVDLSAFAVARYTPLDGNAFRDSPGVNSEPLVGALTLGFVYGSGDWLGSLSFNFLTEAFEESNDMPRFGSITLSRYF